MSNLILSLVLALVLNLIIGIIIINLIIIWTLDENKWPPMLWIIHFIILIPSWPFYSVANIFKLIKFYKEVEEDKEKHKAEFNTSNRNSIRGE